MNFLFFLKFLFSFVYKSYIVTSVLRKILLLVVLMRCACPIMAEVTMSSDLPVEYDPEKKKFVAKGKALVQVGDLFFQAEEMEFDKNTLMLRAKDDVVAGNGSVFLMADEAQYDISSKNLSVAHVRAKSGIFYFDCQDFSLTNNVYEGNDSIVFYGDPDYVCTPSIKAKSIKVAEDNTLAVHNATFRVGKLPLFYWPKAKFQVRRCPFSVIQHVGMNSDHGVYINHEYECAVTPHLKVGGDLDFYKKRGLLFGPIVQWNYVGKDHDLKLNARGGYIHDCAHDAQRGIGDNGEQVPKDRLYFLADIKDHWRDRLDFTSVLIWIKDTEVLGDFKGQLYDEHQRPDSFVEANYRMRNAMVSGFADIDMCHLYPVTRRTPEFRWDYFPTPLLDTDILHEGFASLANVRGYDRRNKTFEHFVRMEGYYGLSMPIFLQDVWVIKPIAGGRVITYLEDQDHSHVQGVVQLGVDVEGYFVGYSDVQWPFWGINGIKHVCHPVLQYRYIPSGNLRKTRSALDVPFPGSWMPIIDLSDERGVDYIERQNLLRVGLKNSWYTRSDNDFLPVRWAWLDWFQDITFNKNISSPFSLSHTGHHLREMYFLGGVQPSNWLTFESYVNFDTSQKRVKEISTKTTVHDSDFWAIEFKTKYLRLKRKINEQYSMKVVLRLNSDTKLTITPLYDAKHRKFLKERIGLETVLWNNVYAKIGLTYKENTSRKDRFSVDCRLELMSF